MTAHPSVLMATDLSTRSERAFPWARSLANALGVDVELVHVVHDPGLAVSAVPHPVPASGLPDPADRTATEDDLRKWAERFDPAPSVSVVAAGLSSTSALAEYAAERNAPLLTIASKGRSGIERLLAGSFAEGVLRRASTPLLIVPLEPERAWTTPKGAPKLLLTVDQSEDSHAVLEPAARWARALRASITLLHVTPELLSVPLGEMAVPPASPAEFSRHMDAANRRLEQARGRLGDLPVDIELLVGDPVQEISRFVEERPIDLVCMASHGRSGAARLLLGSTTESVLRHVDCPVVVFPIA